MIAVLVVDGFSNHDWEHTTRCIRAILTEAEGFDVSVSTYLVDDSVRRLWASAGSSR